MPHDDWLVGPDRAAEARNRIYAAAAELISRDGYDAFTIEALAKRIHCSTATIYRHAGGKTAIRDAVVALQSARIVDVVRNAVRDRSGPDRVLTATVVALQRIRSDPLAPIMRSIQAPSGGDWLYTSPMVANFAAEVLGETRPDPLAAQWLIRIVLSLWYWPVKDPEVEREMLQRFLGPLFDDADENSAAVHPTVVTAGSVPAVDEGRAAGDGAADPAAPLDHGDHRDRRRSDRGGTA
jgi:AcrR family transcriptional regulator